MTKEKKKAMKKFPVRREDIHGAAAYYVIFKFFYLKNHDKKMLETSKKVKLNSE